MPLHFQLKSDLISYPIFNFLPLCADWAGAASYLIHSNSGLLVMMPLRAAGCGRSAIGCSLDKALRQPFILTGQARQSVEYKATSHSPQRVELEQSGQRALLRLFTIGASTRLAARSAGRRSPDNPQNSHRLHRGMRFAFRHPNPPGFGKAGVGPPCRRRHGTPGDIKILSIHALHLSFRAGAS